MPRTFSLRLLLAGVTLACVVSAVAAYFPEQALRLAENLGVIFPALVCAVMLSALSPRRYWSFSVSLLGLFCGLVSPPLEVFDVRYGGCVGLSRWDGFVNNLVTHGMTAFVGALLLGGIAALLMRTLHAAEQRLAEHAE